MVIMSPRAAEELQQALATGRAPDTSTKAGRRTSELVGLATALRTLPDPVAGPSASFRADLRERLDAEARVLAAARAALPTQRSTSPAPTTVVRVGRKRQVLAGTVAAVLVSGAAAAVASTGALPGDVLYPIKRSIEDLRASVGGDAARGAAALDAARERLDEAEALVLRSDPGDVADARALLLEFGAGTRIGSSLLFEQYASDGDPAHLLEVQDFVAESEPRLDRVRAGAPADLHPTRDALLDLLRGLGGDLGQTLAACGEPCEQAGVTGVELTDGVGTVSTTTASAGGSGAADVPTSSASVSDDVDLLPDPSVPGVDAPAAPSTGVQVADGSGSGASVGDDGAAASVPGGTGSLLPVPVPGSADAPSVPAVDTAPSPVPPAPRGSAPATTSVPGVSPPATTSVPGVSPPATTSVPGVSPPATSSVPSVSVPPSVPSVSVPAKAPASPPAAPVLPSAPLAGVSSSPTLPELGDVDPEAADLDDELGGVG